jgi:hypothetical protein
MQHVHNTLADKIGSNSYFKYRAGWKGALLKGTEVKLRVLTDRLGDPLQGRLHRERRP